MSRGAVEFILQRHMAREFTGEPIRPDDVDLLMEVLQAAPSAGNAQPWFFYVVTNQPLQTRLAAAAHEQACVACASHVFVVCAEPERSAATYKERGRDLYCYQDTAAAVENLLIAAEMLGYGACWVGAFDEEAVRKVLDIPAHLRPVAMVPVGPAHPVTHFPDRRPLDETFKVVE